MSTDRPAAGRPAAFELRGVCKAFGPLVASSDVSFRVEPGTIHALVGENGAGKSTCMKMLYGLYRPDAGEILVHGQVRHWQTPRDAIAAGLGMVHQHFMLAGPMSGLDNIILGAEPIQSRWGFLPRALAPIDRRGARRRLEELAAAYHFTVDLDAPVATQPVGVQQRLEILKLLYRSVDILILDEPTAVLTPQEVEEFFGNLRRLKAEGKAILVVTHKLGEVLRFADHVTVLRRGRIVGSRPVAGVTARELAELMVGRAVNLSVAPPPPPPAAPPAVLTVTDLTLVRRAEKPLLADLTFAVGAGEIVAVAGVEGNGQSQLLGLVEDPHTAFAASGRGRRPHATGRLTLLGQDGARLSARAVRRLGVAVVPEDRHRQGLLLDQSLSRNFLLGLHLLPAFGRFGLIQFRRLRTRLAAAIKEFDVRPADPAALARGLSGGNQQKLIVAREFEHQPKLLICAQPTRGVDVGSIEQIHARILAARQAGMAILLVSSELGEVLDLADRILVLFEGRIVFQCRRGEADEKTLGHYMGGGHG